MKHTTDIWFATFLNLKGFKVVDFQKIGPRKGKFTFTISDEDWKKLKLEYHSSIVPNIRQVQERLKELLY